MATRTFCDRCDSDKDVENVQTNLSAESSNVIVNENMYFKRDLCKPCRLELKLWFKPLPEPNG